MDAKYRDLWGRDLPREMLYQLGVYALSGVGEGAAAILYPTTFKGASESVIEIRDTVTGEPLGSVALRPMVLPNLVELLAEDRAIHARRALAQSLAFGATHVPGG